MTLRIATRSSRLALAQAMIVQALIQPPSTLVAISTEGDRRTDLPLRLIGNKGAFIKEIERELLEGRADLAVHSLKDVTSSPHPELELVAFVSAASPYDVLVGGSLKDLKEGMTVGTSSRRRKAILTKLRPDLQTVEIRGNVLSRLQKREEGFCHALMLAEAGLERLQLQELIYERLVPPAACPAPGQGILAVQMRKGECALREKLLLIRDPEASLRAEIELSLVKALGFDCDYPFGSYLDLHETIPKLHLFVANREGTSFQESSLEFPLEKRDILLQEVIQMVEDWLRAWN